MGVVISETARKTELPAPSQKAFREVVAGVVGAGHVVDQTEDRAASHGRTDLVTRDPALGPRARQVRATHVAAVTSKRCIRSEVLQ